jgi:hypothetical protein
MPARRPFDSSLTRVVPVLEALRSRDKTGRSWLPALLALPEYGASDAVDPSGIDPTLEQALWGEHEKALDAPVGLLSWLIRNLETPEAGMPKSDEKTSKLRRRLIERDRRTIEKALARLRTRGTDRDWHILEGPSKPDVFLETPDALVAIEGKRTEAGPTTSTIWMPTRHQMLRHLDGAWEIRGRKAVFGFFIVEGEDTGGIPEHWIHAARETISPAALSSSLPHRSKAEAAGIRRSFLGVTTWQRVCRALEIDTSLLIDRLDK